MVFFRSRHKSSLKTDQPAIALAEPVDIDQATKLLSSPMHSDGVKLFAEPGVRGELPESVSTLGGESTVEASPLYANGLESIYKVETIDLSTVRPMGSKRPQRALPEDGSEKIESPLVDPEEGMLRPLTGSSGASVQDSKSVLYRSDAPSSYKKENCGLERVWELDLGLGFREWISPFILEEPMQLLGLSDQAARAVKESGLKSVGDLSEAVRLDFIGLRSIGQGHLDEINSRLKKYLKGEISDRTWSVDWLSLVRLILGDEDLKLAALCCHRFGLSDVFTLNPAQEMDLRRQSEEQLAKMQAAACSQIVTERRTGRLKTKLREIVSVMVRPWIHGYGGFVTRCQVEERLFQKSDDPVVAQRVLKMSAELFGIENPVVCHLIAVEDNLFVPDHHTEKQYHEVMERVKGYFYDCKVTYQLSELVALIERDLARSWDSYHEGLIEQVLITSPRIVSRKGSRGERVVQRHPLASFSL